METPAEPGPVAQWTAALLQHRQTILPKRLAEPGPDAAQLDQILRSAASAPDHGELVPWRFVIIPATQRARLADAFAQSLRERDPSASDDELQQAREKAFRAPALMLAVVRTESANAEVPAAERLVSAGCAIQNMLLMATALGFGSSLTSGKALRSRGLRELFGLQDGEHAVCFLSIGTAVRRKPARARPEPDRYVSVLGQGNEVTS